VKRTKKRVGKKPAQKKREQRSKSRPPSSPIGLIVDTLRSVEEPRKNAQIRSSHLKRGKKVDSVTNEIRDRLQEVEDFIVDALDEFIVRHPAYPWFSRVKGVGKENIAKVVGLIDIGRAPHVSSLWKFAGYSVENGAAPRCVKGKTNGFNKRLRVMCYRLATSLVRSRGVFYRYYRAEKDHYIERYRREKTKIVPSSRLPKDDKGKRYEPAGVISKGHLEMQARRKMIKLFLQCLWVTWRNAEGLDSSSPYAIAHLKEKHSHLIRPEDMVDYDTPHFRKTKRPAPAAARKST
jgi:hypothetical protein